MAFSAHTDEYYMTEHFDDETTFKEQVDKLAQMIKESKHFIVFSGAGVSTSAGIPDFRGPNGTWTLKAKNMERTTKVTPTIKAFPTRSHMSLVELQNRGILKYLISQNCDGLHRRSGIKPENMSELHGNGTIEYCEDCFRQYPRDFHCTRLVRGRDHYTGRHCVVPNCGGRLLNSTIDFGQSLPEKPLELAYENAKKADLCLVLGSSLTVSPANEMPKIVSKHGKLVICNLQKTPMEKRACMNIHAKCDDLMEAVMEKLEIEIPKWNMIKNVQIAHGLEGSKLKLLVRGMDTHDVTLPSSIFKAVKVTLTGDNATKTYYRDIEAFLFKDIPLEELWNWGTKCIDVKIEFTFMGHYQEPNYAIEHRVDLEKEKDWTLYSMTYRPDQGTWSHVKK